MCHTCLFQVNIISPSSEMSLSFKLEQFGKTNRFFSLETNLNYLCQIFYLIGVLRTLTVANRYDKEEINDVQLRILASY